MEAVINCIVDGGGGGGEVIEEISTCDKKRIVSYYSYTVITRLS